MCDHMALSGMTTWEASSMKRFEWVSLLVYFKRIFVPHLYIYFRQKLLSWSAVMQHEETLLNTYFTITLQAYIYIYISKLSVFKI